MKNMHYISIIIESQKSFWTTGKVSYKEHVKISVNKQERKREK